MDVPVVVHHTPLPVYWQSIYEFTNLRREFGRIMDQGVAVGRELFSGMFDEFPNLKFILQFIPLLIIKCLFILQENEKSCGTNW